MLYFPFISYIFVNFVASKNKLIANITGPVRTIVFSLTPNNYNLLFRVIMIPFLPCQP